MSFEYINVEEAIRRPGMRMVVVAKVPSPWGEAAKGIFHVKGIDFAAVRLVYDNEALKTWAGQLSGPVAIYNDEPPRSGWAEILMLAERLAPKPALLSLVPEVRGQALLLVDKFCGQHGLGWNRRLQLVHAGLTNTGGFAARVATYLGGKYGYDPAAAEQYRARVIELLSEFAGVLRAQREAGKSYYIHGAVQTTAARTMRHASGRARGVRVAGRADHAGAGFHPARASRHGVFTASAAAVVALTCPWFVPKRYPQTHCLSAMRTVAAMPTASSLTCRALSRTPNTSRPSTPHGYSSWSGWSCCWLPSHRRTITPASWHAAKEPRSPPGRWRRARRTSCWCATTREKHVRG